MATSVATAGGRNAAAAGLASVVAAWGLVDTSGAALGARVAGTATATAANVRPAADVTLAVAAGATVGGVRAYTATSGGTDLGGWDYPSGAGNGRESYDSAGQYVITAASSGFTVS